MTEYNIGIPCNTEVVIRVTCKEVAVEAIPVSDPLPTLDPIVEIIPESNPILPVEPESIPLLPVIIDALISNPVAPSVPDPLPPVVEPIPIVINEPSPPVPIPVLEPVAPTEHCYCDLDSKLNIADFVKQLTTLTKGLLYPSESDFPIEVLSKGFSSKMPPIKGIEVRSLDRVIPEMLRQKAPWQTLYTFIKHHASVTAWHYPVFKQKKYTHELIVLLLHPQGTVALKIKLVET